jgi:hypothetical protein
MNGQREVGNNINLQTKERNPSTDRLGLSAWRKRVVMEIAMLAPELFSESAVSGDYAPSGILLNSGAQRRFESSARVQDCYLLRDFTIVFDDSLGGIIARGWRPPQQFSQLVPRPVPRT